MIYKAETEQGSGTYMRYHVVMTDETDLMQSDVSSFTLFVYETETGNQMTPSGGEAFAPNAVLTNSLQPWLIDSKGYNLQIPISGTYIANANLTYRIEVLVTPTSGDEYYLTPAELSAIKTYSA